MTSLVALAFRHEKVEGVPARVLASSRDQTCRRDVMETESKEQPPSRRFCNRVTDISAHVSARPGPSRRDGEI